MESETIDLINQYRALLPANRRRDVVFVIEETFDGNTGTSVFTVRPKGDPRRTLHDFDERGRPCSTRAEVEQLLRAYLTRAIEARSR